jgi:hypothetical protein
VKFRLHGKSVFRDVSILTFKLHTLIKLNLFCVHFCVAWCLLKRGGGSDSIQHRNATLLAVNITKGIVVRTGNLDESWFAPEV